MLAAGFEPSIPASERPQTDALDYASTVFGKWRYSSIHSSRHYLEVSGQLHARALYHV